MGGNSYRNGVFIERTLFLYGDATRGDTVGGEDGTRGEAGKKEKKRAEKNFTLREGRKGKRIEEFSE